VLNNDSNDSNDRNRRPMNLHKKNRRMKRKRLCLRLR
jgi:hypothetical protein